MMKSKILGSTILLVLITFVILWMFHGGADQSKVIIEENVQKDNKVSSVQKNYSELNANSNFNSFINQNNKSYETVCMIRYIRL